MSLQPFFSYFGGKYRLAPKYPAPVHDTIVEPFAGSAGYALRYHHRRVVIVEKDPTIASIWRWLISASARDVMSLPEEPDLAQHGARALIELNRNQGARCVGHSRLRHRRGFAVEESGAWCRNVRARIASQVERIRHWQIIEGDYTAAPDVEATWFVDPPYINVATTYTQGRDAIDFPALGQWCRSRKGQVMVCEAEGASWLPFRPFQSARNMQAGISREVIWTNE